ncbi:magnesium transporter NIPA-domain-containing protein [Multifurca ochricompacta]|uniref:Magnesium transporter NIPA-domain-containing protein n=1 Tax=Multifurca ochricompacta TaxID=376703 RepID=A0AAD4LZT1_9AGAM|nr:magnesium transporter NIPA-domain-containing protein [Multifurca ochricompacta]
MLEDKYVGLALAVSGTVAIGSSFIITKKGLNDAADRGNTYTQASDDRAYLKNPIWWAGMTIMANFAAYSFAPPILVTPLGSLSVIIGAILASYLLEEELGHLGRLGCTICILGSLIIILHAPADKDIQTVDEVLRFAVQPGFLMYCFCVLVFTLVMIYSVAPKYGRSKPLVYISICSLVGSVSIMAIKGFGIAVKLTLAGNNQFIYVSTYVFGLVVSLCIMVQMNYFNKALDTFSTNVVNPLYYVCFSTATIIASLILFQGLNTDNPANTVSLVVGFIIIFIGMHLLELSRKPAVTGHNALENGVLNPRLSLQGRTSIDGWPAAASPGLNFGHARRSSRTLSAHAPLFDAFEDVPDGNAHALGLQSLREDDAEDDELEAATERTRLRVEDRRSRSHSNSPTGSSGDLRRS